MNLNVLKLLQDHNIPYDADGPQVSAGWVNIQCPFCGDKGRHLGLSLNGSMPSCWHCGRHKTLDILQRIFHWDIERASIVVGKYSHGKAPHIARKTVPTADVCRLPPCCDDMTDAHKRYLRGRDFDPNRLETLWGLKGCGNTGPYKFRIIAPVMFQGELVSYQGRDITGRAELRYKACKLTEERVHHKDIVYGYDLVPGKRVVVVEGITDVWRLGPGAVATFGSQWTESQLLLLKDFEKVFVLFDPKDEKAVESGKELAQNLALFTKAESIVIEEWDDPGSASDEDAMEIMQILLGNV